MPASPVAQANSTPSSIAVDAFDPLVVNPGRLSILMALRRTEDGVAGVEFVDLRRRTRLTDGNLASHARRLASGGLVQVAKHFRAGKPVTTYLLTASGREALTSHIAGLVQGIDDVAQAHMTPVEEPVSIRFSASDDDWID